MQPARATYQDAAAMILNARHPVVFTGAGMSTPSGIPDFRSTDQGLWTRDDPMEVASLSVFERDPGRFFNWYRPLLKAATGAQPNPAHAAIASLEELGCIKAVVTQNIDGLHQAAGSLKVIELHGSMRAYTCLHCGKQTETPDQISERVLGGEIPHCDECGTVLKPTITLFEEALPHSAWEDAQFEMDNADVLLVAGTSLEVMPASSLPWSALRHGAVMIMINFSPTGIDSQANLIFRENVAKVLPGILEAVKKLQKLDQTPLAPRLPN